MAQRLAVATLLLACLCPTAWRVLPGSAPRDCEAEGRGVAPRHWIACRGDPGPARSLTGLELILLGRPLDLNRSSAEDLAAVPGIGAALAAEVVRDREENGAFPSPDSLRRVRGIGPVRMERARPWIRVTPP